MRGGKVRYNVRELRPGFGRRETVKVPSLGQLGRGEMTQNKRNYQKELEKILERERRQVPTLLLHSCCAPCSSYVLEYLSRYFAITVLYYNPNIYPEEEYRKRVEEQGRLIGEMNDQMRRAAGDEETQAVEDWQETAKWRDCHPIRFLEGHFDPGEFYDAVRGLERIPEGGERCFACFRLRLGEAAREARRGGFDYVTTTLTISPLKNAAKLNEIGEELAGEYGVKWLPSDFKKRNGYKRSTELSAEYGLYRQDYCGCVFSRREREQRRDAGS